MLSAYSNRPFRQLHTKRTVQAATKNIRHFVVITISSDLVFAFLVLRAIMITTATVRSSLPTQQLLSSPRLLALRQRHVSLDCHDLRHDSACSPGGLSSIAGAVGALPLESGGEGLQRTGQTRHVPGRGARFTAQLLFFGWSFLAPHAHSVAVARQLANMRHSADECVG